MNLARAQRRRIQFLDRLLTNRQGRAAGKVTDDELWRIVSEEVERLPEGQRVVVQKCLMETQSYRQIADALKIPISTVASHLRRGRQTLRARLSARGVGAMGATLAAAQFSQSLHAATVRNAGHVLAGNEGLLPVRLATLMKGVIASMPTTAKLALVLGLGLACATGSSFWLLSPQQNGAFPSQPSIMAASSSPGVLELDVRLPPGYRPGRTGAVEVSLQPSLHPTFSTEY
jgi:hypothetical protein